MGRPTLPLGAAGKVRVYVHGDGFQARVLLRDHDGRTRQVNRKGHTKAAAKRAVLAALEERNTGQRPGISPESRVSELAEAWWDEFLRGSPSPNTIRLYRDRLDRQIIPGVGSLKIRELTVGIIDRHIQTVVGINGPNTARTTRIVLSSMCRFATKNDALERNLVRDIGRIKQAPKREARALTLEQAVDLRAKLRTDLIAIEYDIVDLLDMMLATGLRISEACAIEWDDVDLDSGVVRVGDAVVVREKDRGLYIRHAQSNKLTKRALDLPQWAVDILLSRKGRHTSELVFPSPKGFLRDPSNTSKHVKDAFVRAGYGWATSHVLRKTVASLMDESGLPARAAADQLGHSKVSMTQDHYYGRRRVTGAKEVLELLTSPADRSTTSGRPALRIVDASQP